MLRKNIPATRDDPNAVGIIEDARIRQLPTAAELYGLNGEKKIHHPRKEGDDKLSREDFQILMCVFKSDTLADSRTLRSTPQEDGN